MLRSSSTRFGALAIVFHWVVAMGVVALFGLGLYMTGLAEDDLWHASAPALHKALGILLFGVILLRWAWRLFDTRPAPLSSYTTFERWTASFMQWAMYGLLILIPVSGVLISTADGHAIDVFGWFEIPALISGLPQQEDIAGEVHEVLSWLLIVLAVLHALAAIKHHVFDHDDTLRRMTFKPLRFPQPDEGDRG